MTRRHLYSSLALAIALITISLSRVMASDDCASQPVCKTTLGISAAEIAAYPSPQVESIPIDTKLLYDRYYEQTNSKLDIYNSPNGNLTGSLDAGFNFLTILKIQDGWTEINPDQWVHSESLDDSTGVVSHFSGVFLPADPLPYPMAWALVNFYPSREPGRVPDETYPIVWRYTRLNLYSTVEVDGSEWYQVGVDQWVHQFNVAKIIPVDRPDAVDTDHWVSVDLFEQVLIAYEGNHPVMATLISSGMSSWPTNEGLFHIFFRRERKNMTGGTSGQDYYFLEEVPWTMFFDDGRALHGAYWHDGFGYRRSHGCVNMSITDAHWLYLWVANVMGSKSSADKENGPAVYVYSSGQYDNG